MKSLVAIAFAIGLAACGSSKREEHGKTKAVPSGALATAGAVLSAAETRTTAMCACADQPCRTEVASRPDDPFGEKARAARDGFSNDQLLQWNGVLQRWTECSMRK